MGSSAVQKVAILFAVTASAAGTPLHAQQLERRLQISAGIESQALSQTLVNAVDDCKASRVIGTLVGMTFGLFLGAAVGEAGFFGLDGHLSDVYAGAIIGTILGGVIGAKTACHQEQLPAQPESDSTDERSARIGESPPTIPGESEESTWTSSDQFSWVPVTASVACSNAAACAPNGADSASNENVKLTRRSLRSRARNLH